MNRKRKKLRVRHEEPKDWFLDFILLPFGYSYNTEIADAKKGDILSFFDGGDYPVVTVRRLKLSNPMTDVMSRMRYGITVKKALQIWKRNAMLEGCGASAVSEEECLFVVFDKNCEDGNY